MLLTQAKGEFDKVGACSTWNITKNLPLARYVTHGSAYACLARHQAMDLCVSVVRISHAHQSCAQRMRMPQRTPLHTSKPAAPKRIHSVAPRCSEGSTTAGAPPESVANLRPSCAHCAGQVT